MDESRMRPVDLPVEEPPVQRERPARYLLGFAGAGLVLALGAGSILAHVLDDASLIAGGWFGWVVGWVVWMTGGESLRMRAGGGRTRDYLVRLAIAVAVGSAVGVAADRADIAFGFTLPTAIVVTLLGAVWWWRIATADEAAT